MDTEKKENNSSELTLSQVIKHNTFKRENILTISLFVLLFFALYLAYLIASPFLHVTILSIVFSAVTYPLYDFIFKRTHNSTLSSIIVLVILIVCIVLPIVTLLLMLIPEFLSITTKVQETLTQTSLSQLFSPDFEESIHLTLQTYFPFISFDEMSLKQDILAFSKKAGQYIFQFATFFISNVIYFLVQFFFFILIMFFMLRDGHKMTLRLQEIVPLSQKDFTRITQSLRKVSKAVFIGGFMVAIAQGLFSSVGFMIIGYPALAGSFAIGIASLIPLIGTSLIWIPFSIYLALVGETKSALIFLSWNVIIVSNIDSFLRPYFMIGNVGASILFIFLSILGGVNVFGMLGIFYGPLILAFVMVMIDIYNEEYNMTTQNLSDKETV
ncbi:MAG: AI-2E family transporter [Desulfovibrionaceae bacterium]